METYEQLLEQAYQKVKPIKATERFEIPKVQGMVEGTKTIVTNFRQIADCLRRKPEHLSKFLSKELASYIAIENDRAIFNRKLSSARINEKVEQYVNEFVICKECKKPDTEIIKQDKFLFIHCLACGAKHPARSI